MQVNKFDNKVFFNIILNESNSHLELNYKIMKELYQKALKAYLEMLEIHIDTKTTDLLFHEKTWDFYEKLFDVAHQIWERYVDLDWNLRNDSLEEKKKRANEIISNLKKEIEVYQAKNDLTLWTDDLLWGLADELEDIEWTSKAFLRK